MWFQFNCRPVPPAGGHRSGARILGCSPGRYVPIRHVPDRIRALRAACCQTRCGFPALVRDRGGARFRGGQSETVIFFLLND